MIHKDREIILDFGASNCICGLINTKTMDLELLNNELIQDGYINTILYLHADLSIDFNAENALYTFFDLKSAFLKQKTFLVNLKIKTLNNIENSEVEQIYQQDLQRFINDYWINLYAKTTLQECLKSQYNTNTKTYELYFKNAFHINTLMQIFFLNLKKLIFKQFSYDAKSIVYATPVNLSSSLKKTLENILHQCELWSTFVLSEPEATLIAYDKLLKPNLKYLIIDSGARTTDLCLITKKENGYLVSAYLGNNFCGGIDIDDKIKQYWLNTYHTLPQNVDAVILQAKQFLNDKKHLNDTFKYEQYELDNLIYLQCCTEFFNKYINLTKTLLASEIDYVILSGGSNLNYCVLNWFEQHNLKYLNTYIFDSVIIGLRNGLNLNNENKLHFNHTLPIKLSLQYNKQTIDLLSSETELPISLTKTFYHVQSDINLYFGLSDNEVFNYHLKPSEYTTLNICHFPYSEFNSDIVHLELKIDNNLTLKIHFFSDKEDFEEIIVDAYNFKNSNLIFLQLTQKLINDLMKAQKQISIKPLDSLKTNQNEIMMMQQDVLNIKKQYLSQETNDFVQSKLKTNIGYFEQYLASWTESWKDLQAELKGLNETNQNLVVKEYYATLNLIYKALLDYFALIKDNLNNYSLFLSQNKIK